MTKFIVQTAMFGVPRLGDGLKCGLVEVEADGDRCSEGPN